MLFADFMKLQLIFTGTLHNMHPVLTHLYAKVFSCRHNSSHEVDCGVYNEIFLCFTYRDLQKHPSRGVLRNECSKNMLQICRRTSMRKCDFSKVTSQLK